ncbi:MAG TPA: TlpA disulfide reductase family protein, partial [Solirubrobacteraceae bacterium]|nr:TlpA disulfide reductase family protein [Solirubrobacteraceae bacterium]
RAMLRGEAPDCHCFGQLHTAPVGPAVRARNALLAALAAFVALAGGRAPGPSVTAWVARLDGQQALSAALALALVGLAWFSFELMRQHGRVLVRLERLEAAQGAGTGAPAPARPAPVGLPVGLPAPEFELATLDGGRLSLAALRERASPVLLVFTDPGCGPCNALLPELGRWRREHAADLTLAVISRRSAAENAAMASEHGLGDVLLQEDREVAAAYAAQATPSALVVSRDGRIASPLARGAEQIRAMLARAIEPVAA